MPPDAVTAWRCSSCGDTEPGPDMPMRDCTGCGDGEEGYWEPVGQAEPRRIDSCQAKGCDGGPVHEVLLRLDPRRAGGLVVYVCEDHRRKLEALGRKTRQEDGLGIDQDEELDDD